jgi:hypothetical protein
MTLNPFFPETEVPQLPAVTRLRLSRFAVVLALELFAASKKFDRLSFFEWCGVRLLCFARRLLGHASADSYLEFHPDLPMEI